jgi:hypothetical protein
MCTPSILLLNNSAPCNHSGIYSRSSTICIHSIQSSSYIIFLCVLCFCLFHELICCSVYLSFAMSYLIYWAFFVNSINIFPNPPPLPVFIIYPDNIVLSCCTVSLQSPYLFSLSIWFFFLCSINASSHLLVFLFVSIFRLFPS